MVPSTIRAVGIAALSLLLTAASHPFHLSTAEFDINRKTGEMEVGLAVHIQDLERILSLRAERPVRIDTGKDKAAAAAVDKLIQEYLDITFRVGRADGSVAPIRWVGKQLDVHSAWLFFTCDLGEAGKRHGFSGVKVTHQVLCELEPRQINSVRCRDGRWRRSLNFSKAQPTWTIRGRATPAGDSKPPANDGPEQKPPAKGSPARLTPKAK